MGGEVSLSTFSHTQTIPAGGTVSLSRQLTIPSGTATGPWFVVVIANATNTVLETELTNNLAFAALQVGSTTPPAAGTTFAVSASTVPSGTPVQVTISNAPCNPGIGNWIKVADANSALTSYYSALWRYMNGSQAMPSSCISSATLAIQLPAAAGNYEVGLMANDGFTLVPGTQRLPVTVGGGTSPPSPPPPPAGATTIEGFGAITTGGGGQPECTVTTLSDSGTGSLRDCLSQSNRYVRFALAGTITLQERIDVRQNITIDGHTAPSPGITVTGNNEAFGLFGPPYVGAASQSGNVIFKGFRVHRVGFAPPANLNTQSGTVTKEVDCITVVGALDRVAFDHMSIIGCGDGAIDINGGVTNVTVQWSVIANDKGMLWGGTGSTQLGTDRITFHHNIFVCTDRPIGCDRMPLIRAAGTALKVDMRNNFIEGWIRANGTKIEPNAEVNVVNNIYKCRSDATAAQCDSSVQVTAETQVHTSGNMEVSAQRANLNDNGNRPTPFSYPAVVTDDACTGVKRAKAEAGVFPRDSYQQFYVDVVDVSRCP
jgi:pectate lyase